MILLPNVSRLVDMSVKVFRDEREVKRKAVIAHAGFDMGADLRIARFSENVDRAVVYPGSTYCSACLVLSGGMVRVDRPTPKIQPGSITVEPTWFEGAFTNDEQTDWLTVYVSAERMNEMGRALSRGGQAPNLRRREGEADPILAGLIRSCANSLLRPDPVARLELDGWAQVIGAHLLRQHTETPLVSGREHRALDRRALRIAIAAIEEDLDGDLSLAAIARILDMGTTRLSDGFRAATGRSLHRYVIERRVDRARELIEHSTMTLADIAFAVGFSSQSHLTSTFRTHLGVTPGRYRKQSGCDGVISKVTPSH